MPKLVVPTSGKAPSEEEAQDAMDFIASRLPKDKDAVKLMTAVVALMVRGDVGFWISSRLAKAIRSGPVPQGTDTSSPDSGPVDGAALVAWALAGGTLDPRIEWDVRPLADDGAVYRMLVKEAQR